MPRCKKTMSLLRVYTQGATTRACARATTCRTRQKLGCSHRLRACDIYKTRENGSSFSSFHACEQWMLLLLNCYFRMNVTNNGKFALLLLLKWSIPDILSSSSMWVHSINNDRMINNRLIITWGICNHIFWNM